MSEDQDKGLAQERTVLAWERTGLSYLVLAGASAHLLPDIGDVPGVVGAVAALAVGLATGLVAYGATRRHAGRRVRRHALRGLSLLGAAVALAALAAATG